MGTGSSNSSTWLHSIQAPYHQRPAFFTLLLVGPPESYVGVTTVFVRTYYAFAVLKPALGVYKTDAPINRRVKNAHRPSPHNMSKMKKIFDTTEHHRARNQTSFAHHLVC